MLYDQLYHPEAVNALLTLSPCGHILVRDGTAYATLRCGMPDSRVFRVFMACWSGATSMGRQEYRMFKLTGEDIDLDWVQHVMEEHFTPRDYQDAQELILPSLQEVQERYGYVSEEAVSVISAHLDISETRVFGVMTFYNDFRLNKPGKHVLLVCCGMACRVVGSQQLIDHVVYPRLGIGEKETTADGQITMQVFPGCLGACDQAPLCMVDGTYHAQMTDAKLNALIDDLLVDGETTTDTAFVLQSTAADRRVEGNE